MAVDTTNGTAGNRHRLYVNGVEEGKATTYYSNGGREEYTYVNGTKEGKATIYYYFSSKEDIVCALLETGWKDLWESVEEMVVENISARKKFVKILNQMADIVYKNKPLYEFLFTAPRNINIPDNKAEKSKEDKGKDNDLKKIGKLIDGLPVFGSADLLNFAQENEVKYAINNLATPGHTHDEHLLQEETEKVHERLLMISFIAMAIPSGVAIMTPEISIIIKIIAASAIFSIPLIYFSFRKVQKLLSYKRNMKSEFKRLIKLESNSIRRVTEQNERLKSMDELPEDIKKGIVDLNLKGIASQEKRISILKTKL